MADVLRARDVLARELRRLADERFQRVERRGDLDPIARLLAAAETLEAMPWDGYAARLLDAAAPTVAARPFPAATTIATAEAWADRGDATIPDFIATVIEAEVAATLEGELALLR